jgi:hypothetical protein
MEVVGLVALGDSQLTAEHADLLVDEAVGISGVAHRVPGRSDTSTSSSRSLEGGEMARRCTR